MIKRIIICRPGLPIQFMSEMQATVNSKKIGKHRRGALQLQNISWKRKFLGIELFYEVTLEWGKPKYKAFHVRHVDGTMRLISILRHANHNKLLKVLKRHG